MSITDRLTGKAKPDIDADAIRVLSALLEETGLGEIEIEQRGMRIRVAKAGVAAVHAAPVAATLSATPAAPSAPAGPHPGTVPSPMVGTVYVSPEPGQPPFVTLGQAVKEGDTLFIVEAMKTMNPITAPRSGTVMEIFVKDAQPVEFGQALIVIG